MRTTILRRFVPLIFAGTLISAALPISAAQAVTTFCHGYKRWDVPHITRDVLYESCITYFINGANYDVRAYAYAYIEDCMATCKDHVDVLQMADKLERPLGNVVESNPCIKDPEPVNPPGGYCEVTREGVQDPTGFFSSVRVTLFYTDGHSVEQSPKLCQRATGPNDTC